MTMLSFIWYAIVTVSIHLNMNYPNLPSVRSGVHTTREFGFPRRVYLPLLSTLHKGLVQIISNQHLHRSQQKKSTDKLQNMVINVFLLPRHV